ncbi:MAG: hypothetical protein HYV09_17665 [Deltaproteobacteria bacterium]|nr:hypothetical protein [Deltaproteobacteria bacterium]
MRRIGVGIASIVGSFVVYGAHVACGGGARLMPAAPAQTSPAPTPTGVTTVVAPSPAPSAPPVSASASGAPAHEPCACASPKTSAFFLVSGDEKLVIDPLDAQATLDISYTRGASGKRVVVLTGVVRGYRSDVPAERPTTFGIRLSLADGAPGTAPPIDEVAAHVSTWGAAGAVAPRVYAVVAKSTLATTITDALVEIRGSLTLKDPASGRSITLDKLSLRKAGSALLPERSGVFRP